MALTFRKLEVFVAVAEDGNFRKAAERLGISQPSVSSQVKSMERYLGYLLFDRHRGATAELSVEGREFLTRARDLVLAQSALTSERRRATPVPVTLRAMVGPLLLERRVKPALPRFQESHPHIDLQFVPFTPAVDGATTVRRGDADVLLYTGGLPESGDGVTTEVVSRLSWSLYGSPTLVRPVLQGLRALNDLPFLLCPEHFRITQWTLEQFQRKGVVPFNIVARPPFMDTMLQMVLAGRGVGMFFDVDMAVHLRAGRVLPCGPTFDPVARIMVLGPRARSPEAAPALAFLRNAARREDEIVASQQSRGRPGLLMSDDNGTRIGGVAAQM